MSGVVVARIVDVLGQECARAAVDPSSPIWYFALTRNAAPLRVELPDTEAPAWRPWRAVVQLQPVPMLESDIVAVHVRVTVPPELERVVLWFAAFSAWHLGRFR